MDVNNIKPEPLIRPAKLNIVFTQTDSSPKMSSSSVSSTGNPVLPALVTTQSHGITSASDSSLATPRVSTSLNPNLFMLSGSQTNATSYSYPTYPVWYASASTARVSYDTPGYASVSAVASYNAIYPLTTVSNTSAASMASTSSITYSSSIVPASSVVYSSSVTSVRPVNPSPSVASSSVALKSQGISTSMISLPSTNYVAPSVASSVGPTNPASSVATSSVASVCPINPVPSVASTSVALRSQIFSTSMIPLPPTNYVASLVASSSVPLRSQVISTPVTQPPLPSANYVASSTASSTIPTQQTAIPQTRAVEAVTDRQTRYSNQDYDEEDYDDYEDDYVPRYRNRNRNYSNYGDDYVPRYRNRNRNYYYNRNRNRNRNRIMARDTHIRFYRGNNEYNFYFSRGNTIIYNFY